MLTQQRTKKNYDVLC